MEMARSHEQGRLPTRPCSLGAPLSPQVGGNDLYRAGTPAKPARISLTIAGYRNRQWRNLTY